MIKANELRLGNYVSVGGVKFKIIGFVRSLLMVLADELEYCFSEAEIKPIPITPKILQKCGFEDSSYGGGIPEYENEHIQIYFTGEGYAMFTSDLNSHESAESKPMKYLHELQNLYFAWTGEELKIEL